MDPGNWATNIQGGASFGYTLLIIILLSSLTAMFLQYMSMKLGVVAERDLAQACRDAYHPWVCFLSLLLLCLPCPGHCESDSRSDMRRLYHPLFLSYEYIQAKL